MTNNVLKSSTLARSIYGCNEVSTQAWLNYAYSLMIIAGANGEVSPHELNWIKYDLLGLMDTSEELRNEVHNYDYKKHTLEETLPLINFNTNLDYKRVLLYDAIKMSKAGNQYTMREKEALQKASRLLNIPEYLAKTIEGLVSTELSLRSVRRSIFEFEGDLAVLHPGERELGTAIKEIFGIVGMTEQMQRDYGCALMIIAGADGLVSEGERNWFLHNFATDAKISDQTLDDIKSFQYKNASIDSYIEVFAAYKSVNLSRTLIYNAIKMAAADGHYAEEEKRAVMHAGHLLNIPPHIVHTMEYLISTESSIERMRKTLFQIKDKSVAA
jgi:uncharacterized tellurite resistance protein B-like protein